MEGHRAAWLTLAGVLLAGTIGTPVGVWTVTALNPQVAVPLWLFLFPAASGVLGLYILGAVAYAWPLPARPAAVSAPSGRASSPAIPPPLEYQLNALRQVLAKIAETTDEPYYGLLDAVLKSYPRKGMDPVYEPLAAISCDEGLAELVRLGELGPLSDSYSFRITEKGARRFPRSARRGR